MQIQVAVASHKLQQMPHDSMYLPMFVGHFKHPDMTLPPRWQPDDQPENQQISAKNPHYCELTATYWMWKNSQADAKGLVHYRRLLSLNKSKDLDTMLTNSEAAKLLSEYDLILPKKRNYYVETLWSHYVHSHHSEPLEILKDVIHNKYYPYYGDAFDRVMQRKSAHMFNILIAKAPIFDEFCSWMFDVLENVEHDERLNLSDYSNYEARVFGFLSEFLLDVWLEMHPQYHYTEVNCIFTEKQNWLKKGGTFLIRKFIPGFNSK